MDDKIAKFVTLVDTGSYTEAARKLRLSQPALTIAIAKLEEELGITLVVKGERPLRFTPAGKAVYQTGLKQQAVMESLKAELKHSLHEKPEVRLGMVDTVAAMLLSSPSVLDTFSDITNLSLTVNNSRYLQNQVGEHKLDCAIVVERYAAQPFQNTHLGTEAMVLVAAPNLCREVERDMAKHRITNFITYDEPSLTTRSIKHALHDKSIEVNTSITATIPDLMLNLVLRSKGCAVLPYLLVRSYLASGELVLPRYNEAAMMVPRNFSVLALSNRVLPAYITSFLDDIAAIMTVQYNECLDKYK